VILIGSMVTRWLPVVVACAAPSRGAALASEPVALAGADRNLRAKDLKASRPKGTMGAPWRGHGRLRLPCVLYNPRIRNAFPAGKGW